MPEDDHLNILVPEGSAEVEAPEADLGDETTDEVGEAEEARVNMPEDQPEPPGFEQESEEQVDNSELYTITVDGEELEVTLDEALNGYQRQQAFTRKTQELAQERESLTHMAQLAQALDRDPQGTVLRLAENLGIDLGAGTANGQAVQPTSPLEGVDLEDLDPEVVSVLQTLTAEIQSLKGEVGTVASWRQEQTEAEQMAAIDREAEAVMVRHGVPDLDKGALYRFAGEHNIGDLDAAYVYMREVQAAAAAPPPAAQSKTAKKRALRTEGGRHRTSTKPIARGKMSLEDAMDRAAHDVGMSFSD